MRGEDLLKSINELDPELIEEAVAPSDAKRRRWTGGWYLSGAAACLIFGTVLGAAFFSMDRRGSISPSQEPEETVIETLAGETEIDEAETLEEQTEVIVPILRNERLVVWTEDRSIRIVNQYGQTEAVLKDAVLLGESESFGGKIVQRDEILPVSFEQSGKKYYGIWSVSAGEWLFKKRVAEVELLNENLVCFYEEDDETTGILVQLDGTVVGSSDMEFVRMAEWDTEYLYDGEMIYDKEGMFIRETGGDPVLAMQGNRVLYRQDDGYSMQYVTGTEIWKQDDGWILDDMSDRYINWHDEEGNGVVTDWSLNVLVTDESFYWKNAGGNVKGSGIFVQAFSEGYAAGRMEYLVGLYTDEERSNPDGTAGKEINYYLCDSEFKIIKPNVMREYPSGMLVFEHTSDGKRIPWNLVNLETDDLRLTSLWNGKEIRTEFPFAETEYIVVESCEGNGDPLCIHGSWNGSRCSVFLLNGEQKELVQNGSFRLDVSDEQVVMLTGIKDDSEEEYAETFYVSEDGKWISVNNGEELYYWVNYIFRVGRDSEGVFIEMSDGNGKVRLE